MDTHLLKFPDPQRAALQRTRATIAAALPGAAQVISYGMPTFKVDGVAVVGFDGFKGHNSLFPYSGSVVTLLGSEIPDQVTSKGTVQFPVDKAFPAPLLKRILQVRIQEINACYPKRTGEVKEFYSNGQLKLSGRMKDDPDARAMEVVPPRRLPDADGFLPLGEQTGAWTTFDRTGSPVRTTTF